MMKQNPTVETSIEQWETSLHEICGAFRLDKSHERSTTHGSLNLNFMHGVGVSKVCCDLKRLVRSHTEIANDGGDNIFLVIQRSGSCCISHQQDTFRLGEGDIAFMDASLPVTLDFENDLSIQHSFILDRANFFRANNKQRYKLGLNANDSRSKTLHSYLDSMFFNSEKDDSSFERKMVLENLTMLAFANQHPHEDRKEHLYRRAKNEIAANFRDPTLTPGTLSHSIGETLRNLQLAFQQEEETVSYVINKYRLDAFQCDLKQHLKNGYKPKIAELALNAGFNDISYFNRRYKQVNGMSPRQYITQILQR